MRTNPDAPVGQAIHGVVIPRGIPQDVIDQLQTSVEDSSGLTKRELFAAMAMQGLLAAESENWKFPDEETLAARAALQADALIAELNKEPQS